MINLPHLVFRALKVVAASLAGLLLTACAAPLWGVPVALAVTGLVIAAALFTPNLAGPDANRSRMATWMGLMVVVAIAVQSAAWAFLFDSQQGSDFGVYYRCGFALQPTLAENLQACQSAYISYGDLYWRRSLLSTVPVGWLGGGYDTLKLTNAVLQAGAGAVLWLAALRGLGPQGALIAVLLYALYPERSFALTLATSDHVGLLLTSLGLGALGVMASGSLAITGAASAVAGVVVVALDLARSTGIFFLAAAILVLFVVNLSQRGIRVFALNLTLLLGTMALMRMLAGSVLGPTGAGDGFLRLASSLQIDATDSVLTSLRWLHHFWPAIPPEQQNWIGLTRLLQEMLVEGAAYPAYIWDKAQILTQGYGYIWFAANGLVDNKDTVLTVGAIHVPQWFSQAPRLARLCLIPLLALAFAGCLRAPRTALTCGALGLFSATVGGVVFIGEVQARYLLIALPAAVILAGASIAYQEPRSRAARLGELAAGAVPVAGVLLLGVGLWAVIRNWEAVPWSQPLPLEASDCRTRADQIDANARRLILRLAPTETCAAASFGLPQDISLMTFFLSDGQFPYRLETAPPANLSYRIVAEESIVEGSLKESHVAWRQLPVIADGPTHVIVRAQRRPKLPAMRPL